MRVLCEVKTARGYRSFFTAPSLVSGSKGEKKEERKEEKKGRRWEGRKESRERGGREGGTGGRKRGVTSSIGKRSLNRPQICALLLPSTSSPTCPLRRLRGLLSLLPAPTVRILQWLLSRGPARADLHRPLLTHLLGTPITSPCCSLSHWVFTCVVFVLLLFCWILNPELIYF